MGLRSLLLILPLGFALLLPACYPGRLARRPDSRVVVAAEQRAHERTKRRVTIHVQSLLEPENASLRESVEQRRARVLRELRSAGPAIRAARRGAGPSWDDAALPMVREALEYRFFLLREVRPVYQAIALQVARIEPEPGAESGLVEMLDRYVALRLEAVDLDLDASAELLDAYASTGGAPDGLEVASSAPATAEIGELAAARVRAAEERLRQARRYCSAATDAAARADDLLRRLHDEIAPGSVAR